MLKGMPGALGVLVGSVGGGRVVLWRDWSCVVGPDRWLLNRRGVD